MKLLEINRTPSPRQLRQFGLICVIALPAVGWLWGASWPVVGLFAAIGFAVGLMGLISPTVLKPVFLALTIVATTIGMVFGETAMLLIYFGLFVPIGLIFRLLHRDALQLKIDRQAKTYWQAKKQPKSVTSYYHQS
jgi:hypothetical protein